MTDLRDKIIGLLSPDLCCRADRKADAIIALVIKEYEEFVFAIATKVSQRDARIAELTAFAHELLCWLEENEADTTKERATLKEIQEGK